MIKGYNILILKALEFFIKNPYQEIHLREFSRKMEISVNSAQRFLDLFVKEDLVKEYRIANLRYFKANMSSIVFRNIKLTFSLKKIKESGLIEFLKDNFSYAVLFGSVARGEDNFESDLDIVCIGKKKVSLSKFEKKLGRIINAKFFTLSDWRKTKEENKAFYQDVISQGINLINEMPV